MYKVKVYVDHGYFEYDVSNMSSAIEHATKITSQGVYRRVNDNMELEFHKVCKVKVCGDGLDSEYKDSFKRT